MLNVLLNERMTMKKMISKLKFNVNGKKLSLCETTLNFNQILMLGIGMKN